MSHTAGTGLIQRYLYVTQDAQCYQIRVQSGDALVAGTDGLFDNVHDGDVALITTRAMKQGLGPQECANQLASLAAALAQDGNSVSPFAKVIARLRSHPKLALNSPALGSWGLGPRGHDVALP